MGEVGNEAGEIRKGAPGAHDAKRAVESARNGRVDALLALGRTIRDALNIIMFISLYQGNKCPLNTTNYIHVKYMNRKCVPIIGKYSGFPIRQTLHAE